MGGTCPWIAVQEAQGVRVAAEPYSCAYLHYPFLFEWVERGDLLKDRS